MHANLHDEDTWKKKQKKKKFDSKNSKGRDEKTSSLQAMILSNSNIHLEYQAIPILLTLN